MGTYSYEALEKEIKRRMDGYESLFEFVTDLANWDATTDSWHDLFKNYQIRAKVVLDRVKEK